jgi:hypothetical protein
MLCVGDIRVEEVSLGPTLQNLRPILAGIHADYMPQLVGAIAFINVSVFQS